MFSNGVLSALTPWYVRRGLKLFVANSGDVALIQGPLYKGPCIEGPFYKGPYIGPPTGNPHKISHRVPMGYPIGKPLFGVYIYIYILYLSILSQKKYIYVY